MPAATPPPDALAATILTTLQPHHAVHTLSVLSSSKIHKRVSQTLQLLGFANANANANTHASDVASGKANGKGGDGGKNVVVALRAKAGVASKAVSIAEIAKRVAAEGEHVVGAANGAAEGESKTVEDGGGGGAVVERKKRNKAAVLYQYTALSHVFEDPKEGKSKEQKREGEGHAIEGHKSEENSSKRKRSTSTGNDANAQAAKRAKLGVHEDGAEGTVALEAQVGDAEDEVEKKVEDKERAKEEDNDDDDDDEDEYFTTILDPALKAVTASKPPRATPIITIYLSRMGIRALRDAYGEQIT